MKYLKKYKVPLLILGALCVAFALIKGGDSLLIWFLGLFGIISMGSGVSGEAASGEIEALDRAMIDRDADIAHQEALRELRSEDRAKKEKYERISKKIVEDLHRKEEKAINEEKRDLAKVLSGSDDDLNKRLVALGEEFRKKEER